MPLSHFPALLSAWVSQIVAALDRRSATRLLLLFLGALFAQGRSTVTSWCRAAGVTTSFRRAYNALWADGRRAEALAHRLLCVALLPLMRRVPGGHLLFAIDDAPTPRYGPCVQGAGVHHNYKPSPAGEKFVYGSVWGVLAWLVRRPAWDALAPPLRALPREKLIKPVRRAALLPADLRRGARLFGLGRRRGSDQGFLAILLQRDDDLAELAKHTGRCRAVALHGLQALCFRGLGLQSGRAVMRDSGLLDQHHLDPVGRAARVIDQPLEKHPATPRPHFALHPHRCRQPGRQHGMP
ncbi:MAG TPA: transposase [Gemmataceae bacterium]|nr:transposase [Gemmataceae bacterium]